MLDLIQHLRDAHEVAASHKKTCWELAVEVDELYRKGFSVNEIRQGLLNKHCEMRVEITGCESDQRVFEPVNSLFVPRNACLVVTQAGINYLDACAEELDSANGCSTVPVWKPDQRSLFFDGVLIKRYRCPARNQEIVLSAFQEDGWVARIDDPLPTKNEVDRKQRLQDTIKGLNRNRKSETLTFTGDGTASGIIWSSS